MDGVSIANVIAATCGPAIAFLVGKEACDVKAEWQPTELWKFLEVITKASLVPAREYLQEQLLTARQGATESFEAYIHRLQHMDSELCMISDDPSAVHTSLTIKLVNSVDPDYRVAQT